MTNMKNEITSELGHCAVIVPRERLALDAFPQGWGIRIDVDSSCDLGSNKAADETTGVVRMRGDSVARTEFSSSTGGWTAGGVFPAVEDLGDAVERNPNHDWTDTIPVSEIEARFGGRQLDRAFVSERNGLGEDGGRAINVTLIFGDETFVVDANDFRFRYGLLSDWFSRSADRIKRVLWICLAGL